MPSSPLQHVKDNFGSKKDLIAAVKSLASGDTWLDRLNQEKGLERVSNRKLLRLHAVLTEVKEDHGSRQALISKILEAEQRPQDLDYKSRFSGWPTPRLLDFLKSMELRQRRSGA